jgi:hypothetical protein
MSDTTLDTSPVVIKPSIFDMNAWEVFAKEHKVPAFRHKQIVHNAIKNAVINFDDTFGSELAMKLLAVDSPQVWGFALSRKAFAVF